MLDSSFTSYIYYYKENIILWPKKISYCEKPLNKRDGWIKSKESKTNSVYNKEGRYNLVNDGLLNSLV